jgi:hypothetical protein
MRDTVQHRARDVEQHVESDQATMWLWPTVFES